MTRKVFDAVHGFIHFDEHESSLIDTLIFQRQYNIGQLGAAFLVYPGATHKRFEHAIGTMHVATKIFDHLIDLRSMALPEKGSKEHSYWRRALRLGSLCHDIGHLPFSHTAEHLIFSDSGHEEWTRKLLCSDELASFWANLDEDFLMDVVKISLGESKFKEPFTLIEKIVSNILTGDFFGADRIDYLLRDAKHSGLTYGLFDYTQLIESLEITPHPETHEAELCITENGIESCESLLLARYFMHKRLYQYPSVKAYNFHLSRIIHSYFEEHEILSDLKKYISTTDSEILSDVNKAAIHKEHPRHYDSLCILKQKEKFTAIKIPTHLEEADITQIASEIGIPKGDFGYDFTPRTKAPHSLLFPHPRGYESDLSIRFVMANWAFVKPDYAGEFKNKCLQS